jgi:hypothetical protein
MLIGKTEGRIDRMGRQGRRRRQILDDLMEMRGYWKFKEEAIDHTLWKTLFGRDIRQTTR